MDSRGKRRKVSETCLVAQTVTRAVRAASRGGEAASQGGEAVARGSHTAQARSHGEASGQASSGGRDNVEQPGAELVPRAAIASIDGFPNVVFASQDQRDRFAKLCTRSIIPTRFFDAVSLDALGVGIRESVVVLLNGTGTSGLIKMLEYTYAPLTYEFFSSYVYEPEDEDEGIKEGRVSFRLLNRDYTLTLTELGTHLGVANIGDRCAPRDGLPALLWKAMSSCSRGRPKGNDIDHPPLRYWFRLIGITIFGRKEPNNLTLPEQEMLAGYLNIDQKNPFVLNVAELVAEHFASATNLKFIHCGGVISHLARKLVPGFPPQHLVPMGPANPRKLAASRLLNTKSMVNAHWLETKPSLQWKVEGVRLINLPFMSLPPLTPLSKFDRTLDPTKPKPPTPSYKLSPGQFISGPSVEVGQTSGSGSIPPPPRQRATTIPLPSTSTSGPRPTYPPNYVPIPPFEPPTVMNQEARDRLLLDMCRDIRQARIDESLFAYYTYNANAKEGNIAPDAVHPSWFKFPEGGYVSESDEEASGSDDADATGEGDGESDAAASETDGDGDESDDGDPAYTGD